MELKPGMFVRWSCHGKYSLILAVLDDGTFWYCDNNTRRVWYCPNKYTQFDMRETYGD